MAYGTINAEQMTTQSGFTLGAGNASSFKNRILNGNMVIDQRYAGTTATNLDGYGLDRWRLQRGNASSSPTFNVQQSTTVPPNYKNSQLITVGTAGAPGASNYSGLRYYIEGLNISDFGWGSATASTVTLSFWVNCSVAGTYGVAIQNSANDRSYIASYTVSATNTWEQKSITIAGDTSGTWLTTNGIGILLNWDLGVGTSQSTTAGTWQAGNYLGLTGGTKLSNTLNATFYITGVQLEVGTVATSFDYRPYGTELALCQRYFQKWNAVPSRNWVMTGMTLANIVSYGAYPLKVTMRTNPTLGTSGTASDYCLYSGNTLYVLTSIPSLNNASVDIPNIGWTVAGVGDGRASQMGSNTDNGFLSFNAEL